MTLKLGLIGDNIALSKAPHLHRTAGRLSGLDVTYDKLVPRDHGQTFVNLFDAVRTSGYRGINVTYPYKETAAATVTIPDPLVRAIGAVNTVIFDVDGPTGFNTDYTGFTSAYRSVRGDAPPGTVCLIGSGGVGKAVAFGLVALQATEIRCADLDPAKARALVAALRALGSDTRIVASPDAITAATGADGVVNATPLGMAGIGGSPLAVSAMPGAAWAFDAVYTPVRTRFLRDAERAGVTVISGYELFFAQGVDAWTIFAGTEIDRSALRHAMARDET